MSSISKLSHCASFGTLERTPCAETQTLTRRNNMLAKKWFLKMLRYPCRPGPLQVQDLSQHQENRCGDSGLHVSGIRRGFGHEWVFLRASKPQIACKISCSDSSLRGAYEHVEKFEPTLSHVRAPECFNESLGGVTTKSDIFSFGVILWELITQTRPWDGLSEFQVRLIRA